MPPMMPEEICINSQFLSTCLLVSLEFNKNQTVHSSLSTSLKLHCLRPASDRSASGTRKGRYNPRMKMSIRCNIFLPDSYSSQSACPRHELSSLPFFFISAVFFVLFQICQSFIFRSILENRFDQALEEQFQQLMFSCLFRFHKNTIPTVATIISIIAATNSTTPVYTSFLRLSLLSHTIQMCTPTVAMRPMAVVNNESMKPLPIVDIAITVPMEGLTSCTPRTFAELISVWISITISTLSLIMSRVWAMISEIACAFLQSSCRCGKLAHHQYRSAHPVLKSLPWEFQHVCNHSRSGRISRTMSGILIVRSSEVLSMNPQLPFSINRPLIPLMESKSFKIL